MSIEKLILSPQSQSYRDDLAKELKKTRAGDGNLNEDSFGLGGRDKAEEILEKEKQTDEYQKAAKEKKDILIKRKEINESEERVYEVEKLKEPIEQAKGRGNYATAFDFLIPEKNKKFGHDNRGDQVLIIEDATVTAKTVIEFANKLKDSDLKIIDVITVLDIEKSAKENLAALGINLYALFTWKELYESYKEECPGAISEDMIIFLDKII